MVAVDGAPERSRDVEHKNVRMYDPRVHGRTDLRRKHLRRIEKNARRAAKNLRRIGPYLGRYTDPETDIFWDLRPDNAEPRGILIMGPPGSGKSACNFIPTLLTFPESAFVYDPKFELYYTTAGYRQRAFLNKVLLFSPTRPELSCHINIFDSIRWGTKFEIADVQNIVKLILDPTDKAAEGAEAHWIVTGSILLECVIIWLHYNDPKNCTLRGCYDFLTDPAWIKLDQADPKQKTTAVDEAIKYMLKKPHHPSGSVEQALANGWVDGNNNPSPFHQYVVHSAIEIQGKAPNEKSGVVSTTTRFLHPFRDDALAELTSYSDFSFDDLMNYRTPVTLYFCIPPSDVQRLRVIVRLYLNLLVRAHTSDNALTYVDGTPVYRYRWRCLLAVDEFPQLGKQEQFMLALSVMRSYGLWPMLGVQTPNQILDAFGRYQAVTGMLYYKVFYAPNDDGAAEWISKQLGNTTVVNEAMTFSGPRFGPKLQASRTVQLSKEPLMDAAALTELKPHECIVLATSHPPIRGTSVYWKHNAELRRRSGDKSVGGQYPAPPRSDVILEHATRIVHEAAGSPQLRTAKEEDVVVEKASAQTQTHASEGGVATIAPPPAPPGNPVDAAQAILAQQFGTNASASAMPPAQNNEDVLAPPVAPLSPEMQAFLDISRNEEPRDFSDEEVEDDTLDDEPEYFEHGY